MITKENINLTNPINGNILKVTILPSGDAVGKYVANNISELVYEKPNAVLGCSTGSTPIPVYQELRMLSENGLDLSDITTFNLDEYFGLGQEHTQSYAQFMDENLFNHVNIKKRNMPNGCIPLENIEEYCEMYEIQIKNSGGIDFQMVGIGTDGHIGFMEPGSGKDTHTSLVKLDERTRYDNWKSFFGPARYQLKDVPTHAISMGIATILESKKIVLLATGVHKADIIARAIEGPITSRVPASFLQEHNNIEFILDEPAASRLAYLWTYGDETSLFYQGNLAKDMTSKVAGAEANRMESSLTMRRRKNRIRALRMRESVGELILEYEY